MDRPWHVWALVVLVGFALVLGWTKMALTQSGTTLTLTPAEDTTVKQGTPNANQGDNTSLRIQQGGINRVLVRFDQQSLELAHRHLQYPIREAATLRHGQREQLGKRRARSQRPSTHSSVDGGGRHLELPE